MGTQDPSFQRVRISERRFASPCRLELHKRDLAVNAIHERSCRDQATTAGVPYRTRCSWNVPLGFLLANVDRSPNIMHVALTPPSGKQGTLRAALRHYKGDDRCGCINDGPMSARAKCVGALRTTREFKRGGPSAAQGKKPRPEF